MVISGWDLSLENWGMIQRDIKTSQATLDLRTSGNLYMVPCLVLMRT